MTVDRYTKIVLTVIAVCLVWIAFGRSSSLVTPVSAQTGGIYLAGWIEEGGALRPFPRMSRSGQPAPGKPAAAAPLPIWDAYGRPNP